MSLLTTSAASVHQVAAAAAVAVAGPRGNSLRFPWSRTMSIANTMMSAGWFIEQRTLRRSGKLNQETDARVAIKDLCVAGAVVTNVANVIAEWLLTRDFPEGLPEDATKGSDPSDEKRADTYRRYFRVTRTVNWLCVAGAIAFTPLVNFKILESYRPQTIYRLFT